MVGISDYVKFVFDDDRCIVCDASAGCVHEVLFMRLCSEVPTLVTAKCLHPVQKVIYEMTITWKSEQKSFSHFRKLSLK